MDFKFEGKAKTVSIALMVIGIVGLLVGLFTSGGDTHLNQRFWANLLVNGFFFTAIALGALFFYALQYAAEVGWSAYVKRMFEAMFVGYLPIGLGVILIVLIAGQAHVHHLYHWMDSTLYCEYVIEADGHAHCAEATETGAVLNTNYDEIIANKSAYFSPLFYWGRTFVYLAVFLIFARLFRKWSLEEDKEASIERHFKVHRRSALFLVFFAVFSSTLAWDWIMSIDTHWFSTLFGWYLFSGMWVGAMIFALVSILYLRTKGYFQDLTQSHVHDLAKWMFAISMLWAYLWFSQFMLIWYSDIPEEVTYFTQRFFTEYKTPFILMFFINFAIPFYVMISRDAKRNPYFIIPTGLLIFVGHFVDTYLLVIPGTMFDHNHFGLLEVGMFIMFLGLFIFSVFRALSKAPLVPKNHPFLQESKDFHI
ncbi:MAG: quinol:cytochrome C oxidoreductase [Flavobacteriales bacterium]|nr:quinol:cytochrome C oxidoreductase [Flavobacteriales bacterium]MDG1781445.1 quinol:cytochrome C oxidoreductase [Flavobacteriales bacterium]MDG2247368.1 quinol:cytochrome C oxidoreductase [Flavobacteriales bacterium]